MSELVKKLNKRHLIIVLLCFIIISRVHTYDGPFLKDITVYAVIAHEMLSGKDLYSELWDVKPPGVFITYAVAEMIAGYGHQSIYLLNVIAALITLFGVYFAGTTIRGWRGGLWAAVCWTIISINLKLQADQPNVEVFINACLVWAFTLLVRTQVPPFRHRTIIAIGLLFALASVYKHYTIIAALFMAIVYILKRPQHLTLHVAVNHILIIVGIGAITWLFIFGYFTLTERFTDFYEVIFIFGAHYAGSLSHNLWEGLWIWKSIIVVWPLGIIAICGFLLSQAEQKRMWLFLIMYIIAVQIMISLPGKFYLHYYQLALPPLAIGVGWMLVELDRWINVVFKQYRVQHIEKIVGTLIITGLLLFTLKGREEQDKYLNFEKVLAQDIDALLMQNETFFQAGGAPALYFYSRRVPPAGLFLNQHYMQGPLKQKLSQRLITDLEENKPELIVFWRYNGIDLSQSNQSVIKWIYEHYYWPCSKQNIYKYFHVPKLLFLKKVMFYFFVRRGGKLESRLLNTESCKAT